MFIGLKFESFIHRYGQIVYHLVLVPKYFAVCKQLCKLKMILYHMHYYFYLTMPQKPLHERDRRSRSLASGIPSKQLSIRGSLIIKRR
jgi:hypothetical protein